MGSIGLIHVLLVAAALFSIGLYGAVTKKSTIGILMSLEIMAVAISLNLVAFARWVAVDEMAGWFFTAFQMVVSAAEVGIGLGLVVAIYRAAKTSEVNDMTELKG